MENEAQKNKKDLEEADEKERSQLEGDYEIRGCFKAND